MQINLIRTGPRIGETDIEKFDASYRVTTPVGIRRLVLSFTNGGTFLHGLRIPAPQIPHNDGFLDLVTLYGIYNFANPIEDLGRVLEKTPLAQFTSVAMPFGCDDYSGQIFEITSGEFAGQIRHSYWEDLWLDNKPGHHFVANNMREFCLRAFEFDIEAPTPT